MKQLFAIFLITMTTLAYSQSETITVNTKDLPPEMVSRLKDQQKTQEITQQIETYGKWAGVGKEVGVAVRDGLTAVKDVAIDFSKTDVGMFTMVLIAWKVVGEDVTSLFVGLLIFFIGIPILCWSWYRLYKVDRIVIEDGGWFRSKKYQVLDRKIDGEELGWSVALHIGSLFALIGICAAIIF